MSASSVHFKLHYDLKLKTNDEKKTHVIQMQFILYSLFLLRILIFLIIENRVCEFSPFQVIPYRHNTLVTEFKIANRRFTYCTLPLSTKSKVKFPGDGTEMEIPWLNKSYVNLTASGDKLFFRVRKFIAVNICFSLMLK